jgi:hypothetical protein
MISSGKTPTIVLAMPTWNWIFKAMRKMKQILSITLMPLLMLSMQHCDEGQPKPKTELEKLPPATQEGKDTFGCLINGKAWYAKTTTNAFSDYQLGSLSIGAKVFEPFQSMGISLLERQGDSPLGTGTYNLISTEPYEPWVMFFSSFTCQYGGSSNDKVDTINGTMEITRFDKEKYIISGLFEFTLAHNNCDTLKITDGRFDIRYVP